MMFSLACAAPVTSSSMREVGWTKNSTTRLRYLRVGNTIRARASCFPNIEQPIIRDALKEPFAFVGGMFAGILRLNLNEDPLKEWVAKTVEASGIAVDEMDGDGYPPGEETPQPIEIE